MIADIIGIAVFIVLGLVAVFCFIAYVCGG